MKFLLVLFLCLLCGGILIADTNISGTINTSQTWTLAGSPYIIIGNVEIRSGSNPIITIEAGVQVRFNAGTSITLGSNTSSQTGGMVVNGTADNPVLFTANTVTPTPGDWNYIRTHTYTSSTSSFSHAILEYGGSGGTGMFTVNGGSPAFSNCIFRYSSNYGIYHGGDVTSASVSASSFQYNGSFPMYWNPQFISSIGDDNSFNGNANQRILVKSLILTAAAIWADKSLPLELVSDLTLRNGTNSLVVEPGTQVLFRNGKKLFVGNSSISTYAGSLNATGASFGAADPAAGWNGIEFLYHIQPSLLSACTIEDVNATPMGAVTISCNTLATLKDCVLTDNDNYAVYCNSGGKLALSGCTITGNTKTVGIYPSNMQNLLSGNVYTDNLDNRIHCLGGTISVSASWTRQNTPIWVTADITFNAPGTPVLTIPYGTVLEFAAAKSFIVGNASYSNYRPSLRATGVTFRGEESTAGYWTGLIIRRYGEPHLLSGCTIRDAGYNNAAAIACSIENSIITGCLIENNLALGILLDDISMVALSGNTVIGCGSYPLSIHVEKLRGLTGQNQFSGNIIDRVQVRAGTAVTSGTWHNPGVPYEFVDNCTIEKGGGAPHIKILPGTVIMMPHARGITIGNASYSNYQGSLEAEGVTFTRSGDSAIPAGLVFNRYATMGASSFINCVFEYLRHGSNLSAVYVNYNDPLFANCIFRYNPAQALVVTSSGRATTIDCQFLDNGGYPISATATSFDAVSGTGNYFNGNNPNRILIIGGTLTQHYTWDNPSVPIEVSSNISIDNAGSIQPVLIINSGLVLLFRSGVGLYVGNASYANYSGGLQADGATFSALNGTFGGWSGIIFNRWGRNDSYLRNCIVEYAGNNGNILVSNSPLTYIDGCIIRYGVFGIYATGSNTTLSITQNYILSNGIGVYCTNSANPDIGGSAGNANSFSGNTTFAVQNTTSSLNVNALYNWWGDPSGPYHATLNPSGLGDDVSSYVNFNPWRITDIGDAPSRFHLLAPANTSVVETHTPVLDWEEAIDPSPGDTVTYTLLIAWNTGFTNGLITVPNLHASVYHVPAGTLDDDTIYYWKVSATDTQDQTVWCYENYYRFDTAVPEAPLAFVLSAPSYNETVHLTSNLLSWQATTDPDPGDYVTYTLYWDISAGFEAAGSYTTTGTSAWSGYCAPGSLIYWKVKAYDSTGRETFSPVWRFYVHPDAHPRPPVYFTLTPQGTDMLVEWDDVPGADSYDIYYSTVPYTGFNLLQSYLLIPEFLHPGVASGPRGFYYVTAHDTN